MGCIFRLRCNNLSSLWRTLICLLLQIYLLFLALHRYRLYTEMKWPMNQYPQQWLTVYVWLLGACIPLLVLFAAFGLFKSGNIAGDGEVLGERSQRIIELTPGGGGRRRHPSCCFSLCHSLKSMWQHSCPLPQSIHLVMALCQLVAQQVMLAQLYRYGFINSGDFLNTELDFIYQRARQLATNLPMGDTRLQGFRITSDELADSPIAPNLLPILMHSRLFGIPLEFFNLLLALVAFSCAYPSVFWRASKPFALCFTLYTIIHSFNLIFSYISWSILFRLQETNYFSARPVGIGQYLWQLRPHWILLYRPLVLVGTFIANVLFIQMGPVIIYAYGYSKYANAVERCRRGGKVNRMGGITGMNGDHQPASTIYHPSRGDRLSIGSSSSSSGTGTFCCDGYAPHVGAILLLAMIVTAKAPALYALMLLYQHEEKLLLLSCIAADVIFLFGWILLWLLLTLRREWPFRVTHSIQEIITLQSAQLPSSDGTMAMGMGMGKGKPISQLKNALIVMQHGQQMIVTDNPMEKGSIMRYALKMCSGATTSEDIYWMQKATATSMAHIHQSPATLSRKLHPEEKQHHHQYCCSGNYGHTQQPPLSFNERSPPELSRLLAAAAAEGRGRRDSQSSPVPMAAAPYHQRLSSLPPPSSIRGGSSTDMASSTGVNTFGTLQRGTSTRPSAAATATTVNDYSLYGSTNPYGNGGGMHSNTLGRPSTGPGSFGTVGRMTSSGDNYAQLGGAPQQPHQHQIIRPMRTGTSPSAATSNHYGSVYAASSSGVVRPKTGDGEESAVWRGPPSIASLNNGSITHSHQPQANGTSASYNYQAFRVGGKTIVSQDTDAVDTRTMTTTMDGPLKRAINGQLKSPDDFATSVV